MTSRIRTPLSQFSGELQVFASQLSSEAAELRKNVGNRPVTGATLYRRCLEDLEQRLSAISEDLQSLEAISLDAVSLEVRVHKRRKKEPRERDRDSSIFLRL
jgi:hypothetical protein